MKDAGGDRADSYRWLIGEKSDGVRWGDPRHVEPDLLRRPGQGQRRRVQLLDRRPAVACTATPACRTTATPCSSTVAPTTASTVEGIGLTKAAAIYYQAMTEYMTPVSDFTDHADALDASCADLTGKQLRNLSVQANDSGAYDKKITAADCAQVTAMALAVELRTEPTQCDFGPQLDPNTPALCGDGHRVRDGLRGRLRGRASAPGTLDGESVFGGRHDGLGDRRTDLPAGNKPAGSERRLRSGPRRRRLHRRRGRLLQRQHHDQPGDRGRRHGASSPRCRSTTTSRPSWASTAAPVRSA